MVEDVPLVRILIASPGDVEEERTIAEEAIATLSRTSFDTLGLVIQAIRSERDVHPGIAHDPQEVINQQIEDRHDILLGIMGARFGTPTDRAGSGTEEEFDRMLARHKNVPGSVEIMMYMKDVEIPRDKERLLEAVKIEAFRERLESEGILYRRFKTATDFRNFLDVDLPLCLRRKFSRTTEQGQRAVAALPTTTAKAVSSADDNEDEDLGYLDYVELFHDAMGRLRTFAESASEEMLKYSERTKTRTQELVACRSGDGNVDFRRAKVVTNKAAGDYDELANILHHLVEMLSNESQKGVNALHGMLAVAKDFQRPGEEEKESLSESMVSFLDSIQESKRSVLDFQKSIEAMPRVTSKFNKAKSNMLKALISLAEELDRVESMFSAVLGPVRRL